VSHLLPFLPFLPYLATALILPLLTVTLRRTLSVAAPLFSLYLVAVVPDGSAVATSFLGQDIVLLHCDPLSRIFGLVFAVAATAANLYGWHRDRVGEQVAALLYAGGGMAVVFAGDFLSMLVAWEVMAVASALLVFGGNNPDSVPAGQRYLLVHLAAGSLMLLGLAGMLADGAPIALRSLSDGNWYSYLILLAFCINAAVPPLHGWLSDAYPEAGVAGGVFLSTFTTKAAVYCLVRCFAGEEILLWAGAVMAVYGVVFATMEDNMRRLLSYHIVSQVGYMVCGVGVGSALALNGTVAHAVCHILYKALLFMAVGAVTYRTGRRRLSELGGMYSVMPVTLTLYMVGALSISGAPLFNGFISKSLVVSGAAEAHQTAAVFLLTVASVGTFLSVGLKLPYFAWGPVRQPVQRCGEAPVWMLAAMATLAALCIGMGVYPIALYRLLPLQPVEYHPYTAYHVFEMLLIMAFCGAAFWQARRRLEPHRGRTADLDELYRRPSRWLVAGVSVGLDRFAATLGAAVDRGRAAVVSWVRDPTTLGAGSAAAEKTAFDADRARAPLADLIGRLLVLFVLVAGLLLLRR
jgi:multicomponent Na+:H+ antiporter subunit D